MPPSAWDPSFGNIMIVMRRSHRTCGMVMRKDYRRGLMPDRSLNNMPWMHEGVLHRALTYEYRIENSELGIKADHVEYFFRTSSHKRDEIFSSSFRGIEGLSRLLDPIQKITTGHLRNYEKKGGSLYSDAFDYG